MAIIEPIELYLDNDYEPQWRLRRKNTNSGFKEPAPGVVHTARISATKSGAAIHADLGPLTVLERAGTPGTYYVIFAGDKLRLRLAALYLDQKVYLVVGDGVATLANIEHVVRAARMVD